MKAATQQQPTRRKALNDHAYKYIIDCIDGEGYERNLQTDQEKLQFLYETFKFEYGHHISRYGNEVNTFANWCMGLPTAFNCEYRHHTIIEIAKKWGSIPQDATEKQEDKIIENWFNFIAVKTFQAFKKHNIN